MKIQTIAGDTPTCLNHYLAQISRGEHGDREAQTAIAQFTGVKHRTIGRWFNEATVPKGMELIRLRYFLDDQGYRVAELEQLNALVRTIGKLIAFRIIGLDEAVERIKMPSADGFIRILRGGRGISEERLAIVKELCEIHRMDIERLGGSSRPVDGPKDAFVEPKTVCQTDEVVHLLNALDGLTSLLLPRLEHMLSDAMTSEDRRLFREQTGRRLVFDMSNRFSELNQNLKALCSETARDNSRRK